MTTSCVTELTVKVHMAYTTSKLAEIPTTQEWHRDHLHCRLLSRKRFAEGVIYGKRAEDGVHSAYRKLPSPGSPPAGPITSVYCLFFQGELLHIEVPYLTMYPTRYTYEGSNKRAAFRT